ncbi:hypothetical protein N7454_001634 [Penicillium verhagenii]|nr:hypothetical protein N7454_001634 [Penicillium verhagenii]
MHVVLSIDMLRACVIYETLDSRERHRQSSSTERAVPAASNDRFQWLYAIWWYPLFQALH